MGLNGTGFPGSAAAFTAGLGPRLVLCLVLAVAVVVAVVAVEVRGDRAPARPVADSPGGLHVLRITATADIAAWLLRQDGKNLIATRSDARTWEGTVTEGSVLIEAQAAQAGAVALRLERAAASGPQVHLLWGDQVVSDLITVTP